MMTQFDVLNEELQRRRDECIQLKTLLLAKHRILMRYEHQHQHHQQPDSMADGTGINDGGESEAVDVESINTEGNEYEVGYNTQKILNRILENQLNEMKRSYESEKCVYLKEIKQLREETERQHELIMQNLPPESLADATLKNEIIKLTDSNLVCAYKLKN